MGKNNLAVLVSLSPDKWNLPTRPEYHKQLRISVWNAVSHPSDYAPCVVTLHQ